MMHALVIYLLCFLNALEQVELLTCFNDRKAAKSDRFSNLQILISEVCYMMLKMDPHLSSM